MKKRHYHWTVPLTGMVLFGTAVSAEQDMDTYLNSTNRVTLSLRFGLNIHASFKGFGNGIHYVPGSSGNGQLTPNGDPYNYDDGYVGNGTTLRPDSTGNFLGLTTYWGYDNPGQYDPGADTIAFHNTIASGISSEQSGGSRPYPGVELTYDRQFGEKENWHGITYGLEGAINYLKLSFNDNNTYGATATMLTTLYQLPGTTPPTAPFQGTFDGSPGGYTLIGATPIGPPSVAVIPGATFLAHDQFNGDLWGFRLGPYVDFPMSKKWSLHLSGGLALGLLDDSEAWQQTLNIPGMGSSTASGQGSDFKMLWGYYVGLDAAYQFNKRWGVEGSVQFEDIGKYNHTFSGREVNLDLSRSLFVQVGISYSF